MKKSLMALAFALTASSNLLAADIDNAAANISMDVALYASVTGLDDFSLATSNGTDGDKDTWYAGTEQFNLESNGQVRITASAGDFTNGSDSLVSWVTMDGSSQASNSAFSVTTDADSVHNAEHTVRLSSRLGEISDQKSGAYSTSLSLTVSAM